MSSDEALANLRVLITRPELQAAALRDRVRRAGGKALCVPVLEIVPKPDVEGLTASLQPWSDFDLAIFVSPNAARYAPGSLQEVPADTLLFAAVGPSTARALGKAGLPCQIKPEQGFTSEDLLAEDALTDVDGKRVVIFRGVGGRGLLGETLTERGAEVSYAEVYERRIPDDASARLAEVFTAGDVDFVTATSVETLTNVFAALNPSLRSKLLGAQLVTASDRVVKEAAALGFEHPPIVASGPTDKSLAQALIDTAIAARTQTTDSAADAQRTEMTDNDQTTDGSPRAPHEDTAVSGPADAAAAPPAAEAPAPPPPAAKPSRALPALALLLALGAAALSLYTWWQSRGAAADQTAFAESVRDDITRSLEGKLRSATDAIENKIDATTDSVQQLSSAQKRLAAQVGGRDDGLASINARIQDVEQSIDSIRGVSADAKTTWLRAETEYFLQVANSRLQMARDPGAALAALHAADDRIRALSDPALTNVRAELMREIAAVEAVDRPDVQGMALKLNALAARVPDLALRGSETPTNFGRSGHEDETPSGWQRAKNAVSAALTGMISYRKTDDEITPMLAPKEQFFLFRNLELQLNAARLALLQGDQNNFQGSLRAARGWLDSHFDATDAAVGSAKDSLREMEGIEINPAVPDISGSLRLLRAMSNQTAAE